MSFPDNKKFAFSILDDTDLATVENIGPIYRLLNDLGIFTTKTVWPLGGDPGALFAGTSLQDTPYRDFVLWLKDQGFEIALHNVRNSDSTRQKVEQGLEEFSRVIGYYPRIHANHFNNRDNIYWGAARFSTIISSFYRAAAAVKRRPRCQGHIAGSKYFWGDLCKQRIAYVRNFVFRDINTQRINPSMPYYDPTKPLVNAWFSSADGHDKASFCKLLSEPSQDRLEEEGGTCIVYTHFACGFTSNARVDPRVEQLLRRLARKNGWFVPVSPLLDFLRIQRGPLPISPAELDSMERRWLAERIVTGITHAFPMAGAKCRHPASVSRLSRAQ